MFHSRPIRTLTAWLAALALLCAGLLPLVSHAVVPHLSAQAGLVEVCTVTGMAWVKVDGSGAPSTDSGDPASGMVMGHCDWCATHAPGLGMLPSVATAQLLPAPLAAQPAAFWQAPRPLFAWAAAQPRAPPTAHRLTPFVGAWSGAWHRAAHPVSVVRSG